MDAVKRTVISLIVTYATLVSLTVYLFFTEHEYILIYPKGSFVSDPSRNHAVAPNYVGLLS